MPALIAKWWLLITVQKALVILFSLFLVGCGADQEIDHNLQPLLDQYLAAAPNDGKLELVAAVRFGETLSSGKRGFCDIQKDRVGGKAWRETRTVIIDPVGEGDLRLTVFHELGHCLHDLPHSTGLYDVMNPARVQRNWSDEEINQALTAMFTTN